MAASKIGRPLLFINSHLCQESKSNVVELCDDDPIAVGRIIRYLYTLTYPEEPAEPAEDSKSSPNNLTSTGHSLEQVATELGDTANTLEDVTLDAVVGTAGEDPILNEGVNHGGNNEDSSQVPTDLDVGDVDRSAVTCDESIRPLEQDLQIYVLGDKYGIPELKKKAAQHFEKVLEDADLTTEIFDIIRVVYSSTIPKDRTLRDIITAKVHNEIEHWVQDEEFMGLLRGEGEFGVDLLSHTVREKFRTTRGNIGHHSILVLGIICLWVVGLIFFVESRSPILHDKEKFAKIVLLLSRQPDSWLACLESCLDFVQDSRRPGL